MTLQAPTAGPYVSLFGAVAEQRSQIAFFQPIVFHAHSIDSHDWGQRPGANAARNDAARLETAEGVDSFLDHLARHYRVACITDHMRSGYAVRLAQAARSRSDITVLPGMEVNVLPPPHFADAIHVLAIFPEDVGEIAIERIFAGNTLPEPDQRSGMETVQFDRLEDLRDRIHEAGGLFVLAHVENQRRGHRARFRVDREKTLALFVDGEELQHDLSDEYALYLAKLQPDAVEIQRTEHQHHYAEFAADGQTHRLACLAPADHHSLEEYETPNTATLLKVPACNFASVKEALRFHETRVRLPGQSTEHTAPTMVGLRLSSPSGNGLFQETVVAFSPNLNCLIGPRGSGKSTAIEALRYVLGRNPQLAERAGQHLRSFADLAESTQAANLRDTRIELIYQRQGQTFVLSASFDEAEPVNTRVFTPEGEDLRVGNEGLLNDFPLAIFSWSEMEVLGREASRQRDVVDRLLLGVRARITERERLYAVLRANRAEIVDLTNQLERARTANGGRLGRYRQYRDAYAAINTPEAAALFAGLDSARRRKEVLAAAAQEVADPVSVCEQLAGTSVADGVQRILDSANPETREWWASGARDALDLAGLDDDLKAAGDGALEAIQARVATLETLQEIAEKEAQEVEQELRATTRVDDAQDLLRDQRELARQRSEQVETDRAQYLELVEALDGALAARSGLLRDLEREQDALSAARQDGLAPLNSQLGEIGAEQFKITVERDGLADRPAVTQFLEDEVLSLERAGHYRRMRVADRLAEMARPTELSEALVNGVSEALGVARPVGSDEALTQAEAERLTEGCVWRKFDDDAQVDVFDPEVDGLLALAEQPIDDRVRIKLNTRPVDELSPGQRSSAMLPLIALAETDPLVIDQPEDNLDNAMVGETLTRILASLKERRQIIVSTHNPNIVVGGDAEQVVVLEAGGAHHAEVTHTGSIDDEQIIGSVLEIMEGGRQAFIARRKRYRLDE